MPDLPKHINAKSPSQLWKENNRERYNDYQRRYMQQYRERKKYEKELEHAQEK